MKQDSRRGAVVASFSVLFVLAASLLAFFSGHFFSSFAQEPSASADKHTLAVVFSADCKGQLEPCKCPGGKNGGWLRAATCIKQIQEKGNPTLFLYGGNLLPSDSVLQRAKPRTVGLFQILKFLDCKAMALGPGDLTYGHDYLQETASGAGIPLICANVAFSHNKELVFAPYEIFTLGKDSFSNPPERDLKIGVLGLVGPDQKPCSSKEAKEARLVASDPVEAAQKYIPELRKQCDLVFLLGDLSRTDVDAITANQPGIDAVLCSRRAQQPPSERPPERRGVVFYGGIDLYKNLGIVNIDVDDDGRLSGGGIDAELLSGSKYEDDTKLKVEVAKIKTELAAELRKTILSGRARDPQPEQGEESGAGAPDIRPMVPLTFVGAKECAKCHSEVYDKWAAGPHALAFESLRRVESHDDYDCLPCHTTGYGSSTGFITLERTPDYVGVQCESCHGLGSGHVDTPDVRPSGKARRVCISCHNDRRSPDFDEASYMERIKHWRDD